MARCERKNCTPLWREAPSMSRGPTVASGPSLCDIPAPGVLRQTHHLGNGTGPRGFGLSKKCTPLWREAHFEVKQVKSDGFGALLDVQMLFCVAGARDDALCQK